MVYISRENRGRFLFDNLDALRSAGIYEPALFSAYIHGPHLPPKDWKHLFGLADREELSGCGDPVPSKPIEVYRGVSDCRHRSYIRGLSWTMNPNTAAWFATRLTQPGSTPAVYSLQVKPEEILCITNQRNEEEVIIAIGECGRTKRLEPIPESIKPS
jgi:hypothetical protein